MKKKLCIITASFLIICCLFAVNCSAQPWKLLIKAQGQGDQVTNIVVGMDTDTNDIGAWPVAPSMPNFSAEIKIIDPNNKEYGEIIRPESSFRDWTFDVTVGLATLLVNPSLVDPSSCLADPNVDPNSCYADPNSWTVADANQPGFFPELSWDPNEIDDLGPNYLLQLRLGGAYGMVLVDNMKTTTTYSTNENDALATGIYDDTNNTARMRYSVTFRDSTAAVTQSIALIPGWNWVSFNVLPDDTSLEGVFGSYLDNLEQVKTLTLLAIDLGGQLGWQGQTGLMSKILEGAMYKIKSKTGFTLHVTGTPLNPANISIPLVQGWTWIGYTPDSCLPVEEALASILNDLYQVKSYLQLKIKLPGLGLQGNLNEMCPGMGYKVQMDLPGTLTYPGNP